MDIIEKLTNNNELTKEDWNDINWTLCKEYGWTDEDDYDEREKVLVYLQILAKDKVDEMDESELLAFLGY